MKLIFAHNNNTNKMNYLKNLFMPEKPSVKLSTVVQQYAYTPKGSPDRKFIIIDKPLPGLGYKKHRELSDALITAYAHPSKTLKIYFNPDRFPSFEYICAKFSVSETTEGTIAALLFYKETGSEPPLGGTQEAMKYILEQKDKKVIVAHLTTNK